MRGLRLNITKKQFLIIKRTESVGCILATNDIKDKFKSLEIYHNKDAVEKKFDDLKNDLDMKRLRIYTQSTIDGRIFYSVYSPNSNNKAQRGYEGKQLVPKS